MNGDQQVRLQPRQAIELVRRNIELEEKVERMEAREAELVQELLEERKRNEEIMKEFRSSGEGEQIAQKPTTMSSILSIQQILEQKQNLSRQLLQMERRAVEAEENASSLRIFVSQLKCQLDSKNRQKKSQNPLESPEYRQLEQNYQKLQQEYEGIIADLSERLRQVEAPTILMGPSEMSRLKQSQFHVLDASTAFKRPIRYSID